MKVFITFLCVEENRVVDISKYRFRAGPDTEKLLIIISKSIENFFYLWVCLQWQTEMNSLKSYAPLQKALNDFFHVDYNANESRFVALRNDDQRWFSSSSFSFFYFLLKSTKNLHTKRNVEELHWHTFPLNKKFFFISYKTQFVGRKRREKKPERIFFLFLDLLSAGSFKFIYLLFPSFRL